MKYSELQATLQNLTNENISISRIGEVLGETRQTMHKRVTSAKGDVPKEEIELLEKAFNVSLFEDCIEIEHIHINPSCGRGTVVLEEAIATPVKIGREIIKDLWHVQNPNVLKLFKASGDSMADTIEDGNILLVDTSRTDYQNGGIYLLTINNDWFIKRLRKRLTGELDVISDNSKYPIETFKPNDDIEVVVKGRVIKNLSRGL